SARTATVSATFFMIVPFLAYGDLRPCGNNSGLGLTLCVKPAAGDIDLSRVTQSSFDAEPKSFGRGSVFIDGYKDFLISLIGDPGPQARRAFPGAGRSYAAAHLVAAAFDGAVGRGVGAIAGAKPAPRIASCPHPVRLGTHR